MNTNSCGSQKRLVVPLELKWQAVMSYIKWVLVTKPGPSGWTSSSCNCWVISPDSTPKQSYAYWYINILYTFLKQVASVAYCIIHCSFYNKNLNLDLNILPYERHWKFIARFTSLYLTNVERNYFSVVSNFRLKLL